jgi:hypothetical protein
MNPFLEQADTWEDFHSDFIVRIRETLSGLVGPNYLVKVEVRLLLHELSAEERRFMGKADVGVAWSERSATGVASAALAAAPIGLTLPAVEIERHSSLEIRDRRNRRLVTALEVLSPSNKTPGPDRDDYLAKRRNILATMTHFVEIDLRRGGVRPNLPELPPCDYYVLVSRYADRPRLGFWPIGLREALPVIPIPLADPDPDVPLDLKHVLDRAYDAAAYGKYIYREQPEPALSADDAGWAAGFVPGQG